MAKNTKNTVLPLTEEPTPPLAPLLIPTAVAVPFGDPYANLHAVGVNAVRNGLKVFVAPYQRMLIGDFIEVFWGAPGLPVASTTVDEYNINTRIGLNIPESSIQAGRAAPYYRLTALSTVSTDASPRDIWVKFDIPGGVNPDHSTQENRNIAAPIVPPDVAQSGVNKARAQSGVEITIQPYLNMAEYDRIEFWWGGERIWVTVQPSEVGQPVRFTVNEATILEAGDGEIVLHYQIIDAALNPSDGWSLTTKVMVTASNTLLGAPLVAEAVDGVVDLAVLAGRDATVQVIAMGSEFTAGDTIDLLWAGRDAGGAAVDYSTSRVLQNVPQVAQFSIPNAKVAAIAQGVAIVSYTLRKLDGRVLPSQRTQVSIKGQAVSLAAPSVDQANGDQLAYDLSSATVRIAPYPSMAKGNEVTMIWSGRRANGQPTYYTKPVIVTQGAVGHDILFEVPRAEIAALTGGTVEVYYQVKATLVSEVLAQQSARLQLQVTGSVALLPAPTVPQADGERLNPVLSYVDVQIPAYAGIAIGDEVRLAWIGDMTGPYPDSQEVETAAELVSGVSFRVYGEDIAGNLDHYVTASYSVVRGGVQVGKSASLRLWVGIAQVALPAPRIDEAQGNVLITADVPASGASVRIIAAARLMAGDTGTVHWRGRAGTGTTDVPFTVLQTDQDVIVTVPRAVVAADNGTTITVDYTVNRAGSLMTSDPASYAVQATARNGRLLVMGARSRTGHTGGMRGIPYLRGQSSLTALDAQTRQPVEALWRYVDQSSAEAMLGSRFVDTRPTEVLEVQALGDRVQIRPRNLTGNGQVELGGFAAQRDTGSLMAWGDPTDGGIIPSSSVISGLTDIVDVVPSDQAFAALRKTGQVVAWGDGKSGGDIPTIEISSLTDIVDVVASRYAYTARRATGQVVAWGHATLGGTIPDSSGISGLTDIVDVVGNWYAFTARRATGQVVAWGDFANGGSISPNSGISGLTDIVDVVGNAQAFAARRATGQVVAWGDAANGGSISPNSGISGLTDVVDVTASSYAFAARRKTGQVVVWGDANNGGSIPASSGISSLSDIISVIPNDWAFTALRKTGQIVAWGDATKGGSIPTSSGIAGLTDIVEVVANAEAFAARRKAGQVVVWGNAAKGGSFSNGSVIPGLTDIIQVVASAYAFAALRANGTVVAWGDINSGGVIPTNIAPQLIGVRALYANHMAFVALTDDNRVLSWGSNIVGGNNTTIPAVLQGNISYELNSGA